MCLNFRRKAEFAAFHGFLDAMNAGTDGIETISLPLGMSSNDSCAAM
jgi:hypothetical protein